QKSRHRVLVNGTSRKPLTVCYKRWLFLPGPPACSYAKRPIRMHRENAETPHNHTRDPVAGSRGHARGVSREVGPLANHMLNALWKRRPSFAEPRKRWCRNTPTWWPRNVRLAHAPAVDQPQERSV